MKEIILITGANGMLAQQLAYQLEGDYIIRFLSRKVSQDNEYLWNIEQNYIDPDALKDIDIIIHLAGSSLADGRWTKKRKKIIYSSRVDSAQLILTYLEKYKIKLKAFISASAVGYYGSKSSDIVFDENQAPGSDFLSGVCVQWENAAQSFHLNNKADRIVMLRIGIILDKNKGALKKIIQPIKLGLGAVIGTGKQYMPWIHIQDLCSMFKFVISNSQIEGAFNAVAPQHITNNELTSMIGKKMRRPILLPNIPKFIISMVFGEMGSLLLHGNKVSSNKIIKSGFSFEYASIQLALKDLL